MEPNQKELPSVEVDEIKTFEDRIVSFMERHQELKLCSTDIVTIMDLYQQWAELKATVPRTFALKVLHFTLERMYWSEFENSKYVTILLTSLFDAKGHLGSIFMPQEIECPSLERAEVHRIFRFFARHAYQEKLLFNGRRLPATKVFQSYNWYTAMQWAMKSINPSLLYEMMRYGFITSAVTASVVGPDECLTDLSSVEWLSNLCQLAWTMSKVPAPPEFVSSGRNCLRCLDLIVNDCPQVDIFYHSALIDKKGNLISEDFRTSFMEGMDMIGAEFPSLKKHFFQIKTLKQCCRLRIRKLLDQNWLLPDGIYTLSIPESLKLYLDLLDD